jgi:hypothetical protein
MARISGKGVESCCFIIVLVYTESFFVQGPKVILRISMSLASQRVCTIVQLPDNLSLRPSHVRI